MLTVQAFMAPVYLVAAASLAVPFVFHLEHRPQSGEHFSWLRKLAELDL